MSQLSTDFMSLWTKLKEANSSKEFGEVLKEYRYRLSDAESMLVPIIEVWTLDRKLRERDPNWRKDESSSS